jgi:hypothetical protein
MDDGEWDAHIPEQIEHESMEGSVINTVLHCFLRLGHQKPHPLGALRPKLKR